MVKKINFAIGSAASYFISSKRKKTMDILFAGKIQLLKSNGKLQIFTKENLTALGELIIDLMLMIFVFQI